MSVDLPVEHCPGWDVADLVWHVTEVHWFWGTIVDELLTTPPDASRRPAQPADDALLAGLEATARRLVHVLGGADQTAHCWTWAAWQQDVAFVTRHQVQEAAVHHWDAASAAGADWRLAPGVAADAVDAWTLTDGRRPGTAQVSLGAVAGAPQVAAPAAGLLLWLYGRRDLDTGALPSGLVDRFRAMTFTE